ncbi:MAG: class I SAM-dependent RNA methyltransferase [Desulfofustis sp.]|nr:class I SAM-dependent RNA methyltransferase [Desulfofustis sp.]
MNCNNQVVTIRKLVNGGYGLAHTNDGTTLFARFGLPGERVSVHTTEHRKKTVFGHVIEVYESHPGRISPPCPYYGRCGGCNLQHLSYEYQGTLKQQIVTELLAASDGEDLRRALSRIEPIRASPMEMNYRQRIRLAVDSHCSVGFRNFRSRDVVAIESCLLAVEPINSCFKKLARRRSFQDLVRISEQLELCCNPLDETVSALFYLIRSPRPADRRNARALTGEVENLDRVFFGGSRFAMEGPYTSRDSASHRLIGFSLDKDRPLTLRWEVGGFSQVNLQQNRYLIDLVTRLATPDPQDLILDLYCGMGNFSLPLALHGAEVHGIESQGSAVRSGRRNCMENNITTCHFEQSDVESACRRLAAEGRRFDIVVCDPPRRGLAELIPYLARIAAGKLIYISCDPATLSRDLSALTSSGFEIRSIHPLDMFPQTHHIETVVAMNKRG